WMEAAADMQDQLAHLLPRGFMVTTPAEWLVHLPRFLAAVRTRLAKLRSSGPDKDLKHAMEVRPFWQAYQARAAQHARDGIDDPELRKLRWMIEELRVSLFA